MKWTFASYRLSRNSYLGFVIILVSMLSMLFSPLVSILGLVGVALLYRDWKAQKRFWLERHPSCGFRDLLIEGNPFARTQCQEWQRGRYYENSIRMGEPYKCKFCEFRTFVPAIDVP